MTPPTFVEEFGGIWLLREDRWITPSIKEKNRLNWDDAFCEIRSFVQPRRFGIMIDVGAYIGDSAAWFTPELHCVNFEPQRDAFTCLTHNMCLETNIPYPAGNGEMVDLDYVGSEPGNLGSRGVKQGNTVRTIRIDDLHLEKVALIKVDAEGWEPKVLDGASETILRCKPIVVAEINKGRLAERGFKPEDITDRFRNWKTIKVYEFNADQLDLMFIPTVES